MPLRFLLCLILLFPGCSVAKRVKNIVLPSPSVSQTAVPMAWDHRPEAAQWTGDTMAAMAAHGRALSATVPSDIAQYCPGYASASMADRNAFWVGLLSALAKHESTWRPEAIGGGGKWFGLTQIAPATARGYKCRAQSGQALLNGSDNLSCAVRIANYQVARDAELVGGPGRWRGMARDWAPFRNAAKRAQMAAFTSSQPYCQ